MKSAVITASVLFMLLLAEIKAQECAQSLNLSKTNCPSNSAPGDIFSFCISDRFEQRHSFPDNWRILFDTYRYFSLLSSSTWLSSSPDLNLVTWGQIGGLCERKFYVCTRLENEQNWAFSQPICTMHAKEILLDVSYSFGGDAVTLFSTQTKTVLDFNERRDTSNYLPLSEAKFQGSGSKTLRYPREDDTSSLYFAIKDTGSCGEFSRMVAYYQVCNSKQVGLVRYKEFASPPLNTTETFLATCVCNAHPVTNMEVTATSDGKCTDVAAGGARCKCNDGYKLSKNGLSCEVCPAGTYRTGDNVATCTPCPANTYTDKVGAAFCQCLPGFFRDDKPVLNEGPEDACQAPPGPPMDLTVESRSDKTVTLSWINIPSASYRVCTFNALNIDEEFCSYTMVHEVRNGRAFWTIENLKPASSYFIEVESINAVSDQDPENRVKRISEIFNTTTEGVPNEPILKRLCTVVIWKPPPTPNGYITSYEVCFGECPTPTQCHNVSSDENFFLTNGAQRAENTGVQIRASNSEFKGPYTNCAPIGCENTDCPVQTTPTAAASSPTTPSSSPTTPSSSPTTPSSNPTIPSTTTSAPSPTTPSSTTSSTTPKIPALTLEPTCQGPYLSLKGEVIATINGTSVDMSQIGMENDALHCITEYQDCCKGKGRTGEWFKVNETGDTSTLPKRGDDKSTYRNRGDQVIRLNVRFVQSADAGLYSCCIPDSCGETQCISTTLV